MRKCKYSVGDTVSIDLEKIKEILPAEVFQPIKEFSEKHNNTHKITNIYAKNLYRKDVFYRIELDKEFVFLEDEII